MGARQWYRLVASERLFESLGGVDEVSFRATYDQGIAEIVQKGGLVREPAWSECLAVGSESFVESVQRHYTHRREFTVKPKSDRSGNEMWTLRESGVAYNAFSKPKSDSKAEWIG